MKKLFLILAVLAILLCACGVAGVYGLSRLSGVGTSPELAEDCPEIPVSQAAAVNFLTKMAAALRSAPQTGQVSLDINQEEVTSVLALGAQAAEQLQSLPNLQNLEKLGPEQLQQLEGLEGAGQLEALQGLMQQQLAGPVEASGWSLSDLSPRLALEQPQICMKRNEGLIVRGYVSLRSWRQPVRIVTAPRAAEGELVLDFVEGQIGPIPMPETVFDLLGNGLAGTLLTGQQYAEITQITVDDGSLTISGRINN